MSKRIIAIVDADADFLEQMQLLLGNANYTTMTFAQLEGTYDALRTNPPDAAIVGLHFPNGKHGIDLVTVLKLREETRGLPVIVTSADASLLLVYAERLQNRAFPAVWTMAKPLDGDAVLAVLAQALAEHDPPPQERTTGAEHA
jgi:DNA-binding NtrC family response regulator